MKNKIFICSAAPDANNFTKWLVLKQIVIGYEVLCDVLYLDKGVDFWSRIEKEIRDYTFKILTISSATSNQCERVLRNWK